MLNFLLLRKRFNILNTDIPFFNTLGNVLALKFQDHFDELFITPKSKYRNVQQPFCLPNL